MSPILYAHEDWIREALVVFEAIESVFDTKTSERCGTRVHISPTEYAGLRWTTPELRGILKAICVFNDSILDRFPSNRKKSGFTAANFSDEHCPDTLRSLNTTACETGQYGPVFALIDNLEIPEDFPELFEKRWWSFNFSNLAETPGSCGTIEFRSPPGFSCAKTATHWIVWIMSFVAAALKMDWDNPSPDGWTRSGAVAGLRQFLFQGLVSLPEPSRKGLDVSCLRRISANEPTTMTAEEISEVKALKERKLRRFMAL